MKKMLFMVAAATVLLSSCGGSKKADTTATEETSTEVKSEAKTLEGLPFDTQKVMADAKGLLFVTNQFDDATISYATVDINEDGVNEVIFRCAHTNNTIDYVIMQYDKDSQSVGDAVMTCVSDEDYKDQKVGYGKGCLVKGFIDQVGAKTVQYTDLAEHFQIHQTPDLVMTPGVTEMEESVMKEYVAAHQDITWVGEDTKWLAWE